jgi:ADP-ribose pyrophosphatase YjhB (NUDIX family)
VGSLPGWADERQAQEIAALAQSYGTPVRVEERLPAHQLFSAINGWAGRVAEVVFAIQRPNGRLLTMTKEFYPAGAYRLPSGSIREGEGIEAALRREIYEETGLSVAIARFLAIVRYNIEVDGGAAERFVSYAFLVREVAGELLPQDAAERVSGFREILPAELAALADSLAQVPDIPDDPRGYWNDWGRFRAIVHRVLAELLNLTGLEDLSGLGTCQV